MLGDPAGAATGSVVRELRPAWRHAETAADDRGHLLSADALRGDCEDVGMRGVLRRPRRLRAGGTATDAWAADEPDPRADQRGPCVCGRAGASRSDAVSASPFLLPQLGIFAQGTHAHHFLEFDLK